MSILLIIILMYKEYPTKDHTQPIWYKINNIKLNCSRVT